MPAPRIWAGGAVNIAWASLMLYVFTRPFVPESGAGQAGFVREVMVPFSAHLGFFGVMAALLVAWAFAAGAYQRSRPATIAAIFAATVAYGIAIELAQRSVPGRFPSAGDAAIDAAGAALALAAIAAGHRRLSR